MINNSKSAQALDIDFHNIVKMDIYEKIFCF